MVKLRKSWNLTAVLIKCALILVRASKVPKETVVVNYLSNKHDMKIYLVHNLKLVDWIVFLARWLRWKEPCLPSSVGSFASGQIDKMNLAHGFVRKAVHEPSLNEGDGEYGMASTKNSKKKYIQKRTSTKMDSHRHWDSHIEKLGNC